MNSHGNTIIRGAARLFFAEALLIPTGFITAVFLARELQPAGYGTFALVSQFVIWTEYLLVSALENATITFLSGSTERKPLVNTVYIIYAVSGSLAALALALLAPAIALLVKAPETVPLLRLLSIDIPVFALAHAGRHIAAGCQQFRHNAAMRSVYWISRLIFIIWFVSIGLSIRGAIIGLICASAVEAALGFYLVRPDFLRDGFATITRFWHVTAPLQLAEIGKRLLVQELIILKALGGSAASVGNYGAAKNLALAPILLSRAINPALLSILNKARHGNEERAARQMAVTTLRSLFWILPAVAIGAACAPEIVSFIFGTAYTDAAPLFSLLLFAGTGFLTINIGIVMFTAWNMTGMSLMVTLPMLPAAAAGYIIGYPAFGATGIAAATLAAVLTGTALTLFTLHRRLHLGPPGWTVIRSIGVTIAVTAAAAIWPASGGAVLLKIVALTASSLLLLSVTGEFSWGDIAFLRNLVKGQARNIPEDTTGDIT
ncbi:oligosaccharide flippase family protein [bacterium]|nr:oligosaccharide flippase family protein [bacterium]